MSQDLLVDLLFHDFSEDELAELFKFSNRCKFSPGDFIFHEGDESNAIYIIFSGNVEIFSSVPGHDRISFPAAALGTVLGEIAFFDSKPRTASARSLDNMEAVKITKEAFSLLENVNPKLALKVLKDIGKIAAERLRWADEQVKQLSQMLESSPRNEK